MNYRIPAAGSEELRLNETDRVRSVLQSVAIILATPKGSVPLCRDFGLDQRALDKPLPVAKVLLVSAIREAIGRWEPRAEVTDISFSQDPGQPGLLIPTVEVEIKDE